MSQRRDVYANANSAIAVVVRLELGYKWRRTTFQAAFIFTGFSAVFDCLGFPPSLYPA
jgi:hypothetical protein